MGFFNRRPNYPYNRYPQQNQSNLRNRAAQMANVNNSSPNLATELKDYGPYPFATNIDEMTKKNNTFRTAIWSGPHLQVTVMSIPPGGEIGLEKHPNLDQFLRLEAGEGLVMMGTDQNNLDFKQKVSDGYAFIVPANTWHNLINIGNVPIKLYSIYAPPNHPFGTVHQTKADADAEET